MLLAARTLINKQSINHLRIALKSFLESLAVSLAQLIIDQSQVFEIDFLHDWQYEGLLVSRLGDVLLLTQENRIEFTQVHALVNRTSIVGRLEVLLFNNLIYLLGETIIKIRAGDHILEFDTLNYILDE